MRNLETLSLLALASALAIGCGDDFVFQPTAAGAGGAGAGVTSTSSSVGPSTSGSGGSTADVTVSVASSGGAPNTSSSGPTTGPASSSVGPSTSSSSTGGGAVDKKIPCQGVPGGSCASACCLSFQGNSCASDPSMCGGVAKLGCDDTADCQGGVCCANVSFGITSVCQPTANGCGSLLCKEDSECKLLGDSFKCVNYTFKTPDNMVVTTPYKYCVFAN